MWKDYFSFNKRQRNGILVLLFLIVAMILWLNISNHISPPVGNADASVFKTLSTSSEQDSLVSKPVKESPLIADTTRQRRVCVNTASVKELSKLPGIGYYLAQAIVNYREQHGPYKTMKDLLKNAAVDTLTFNKIAPFLTTN